MTAGQDKSVKLWNPNKGRPLKTYSGHGYEVLDVRGSCDNSQVRLRQRSGVWTLYLLPLQIVSASMDKTIMLWDVSSGNWTRKWRGHQVMVIMILSIINMIITSGGCELRLIQRGQQPGDQWERGHHGQDLGHQVQVTCESVSQSGNMSDQDYIVRTRSRRWRSAKTA